MRTPAKNPHNFASDLIPHALRPECMGMAFLRARAARAISGQTPHSPPAEHRGDSDSTPVS